MPLQRLFVVVGANLAGGVAAAELRERGFDGRVVLIGEEPLPPYERPPLSKEYLRGEHTLEQHHLRPLEWYEENNIELQLGVRAAHVDTDRRTLTMVGGAEIVYDKLLVATGTRNRRLEVPGYDLNGVVDLRTARDADRIRELAVPGAHCVVIGMGLIGAEVAASLRSLNVAVTIVEPFETPLFRVLGPDIGAVVRDVHAEHGVEMHFGDTVEAFLGSKSLEAVKTRNGSLLGCDFAVVAVGVQPNIEFVHRSGIEWGDGIFVDAGLETNIPGVFAAGDVAMHAHPSLGPVRVEHWENALKMGRHAARSMCGDKQPFDDPHWFWSDQYDLNIQIAGLTRDWDGIVYRGSLEDRNVSAFFTKAQRLVSVISLNRPRDARHSMKAIRVGARPDLDRIRDEDIDVRSLLAGATV